MSRGLGKWQRAILKALETHGYVFPWHIFPDGYGRSRRFVYSRAAERLAKQGLVTLERVNGDVCVTRRQISANVSRLPDDT
jgi:hypothetical protein